MSIAILSHSGCEHHFAGEGHPEQPNRIKFIQNAFELYAFSAPIIFKQARLVDKKELERVHSKAYVDWVFANAPQTGMVRVDEDTLMSPGTLAAARRAAGAAVQAVDMVMADDAKAVFCNVRPPGHHAEREKGMGFCIFNNLAVGVAYALEKYQLERIAIVDFDVHRGNGTQAIFRDEQRILYCSSFENPLYPGYEEKEDTPNVISVPVPAEISGQAYREKVAAAWFDRLTAFKPQLLFFSAGFDAHADDPLAYLNLVKDDYVWLTKEISRLVKPYTGGRVISVLEGGYCLQALADCVPAHVDALLG